MRFATASVGVMMCTLTPALASSALSGSFLDHVCPGGQQTCADGDTCCDMGGSSGYMCCETTLQGPCCGAQSAAGGGCCTADETCCSDDKDYACCMQQNTYCVAKDRSMPTLPARCCPRWTVGCETGSVGGCDPAQPWQWSLNAANGKAPVGGAKEVSMAGRRSQQRREAAASPTISSNRTAYVLVVSGIIGGLEGMTVNVATGAIETRTRIKPSDFDDDPAGESTREFMFDTKRKVFYYVDANFTANGGARPTGGREMCVRACVPVVKCAVVC